MSSKMFSQMPESWVKKVSQLWHRMHGPNKGKMFSAGIQCLLRGHVLCHLCKIKLPFYSLLLETCSIIPDLIPNIFLLLCCGNNLVFGICKSSNQATQLKPFWSGWRQIILNISKPVYQIYPYFGWHVHPENPPTEIWYPLWQFELQVQIHTFNKKDYEREIGGFILLHTNKIALSRPKTSFVAEKGSIVDLT